MPRFLGILIEKQSNDSNKKQGIEKTEEMKIAKPGDHQGHLVSRRVANLTT